uniref:Chromo domain-containing protein n=1 Tax=Cajanus cajan TaxID=3821 RepID=A0A151SQJ1_CAJCA|nr:hypothetical protein KK1_003342 [Cajanus cajan]KYP57106.1 hypothetical protein KK1_003361 [Cajanus cajan]
MKKYADAKRLPKDFAINDMVLVKLQPYRQHIVALKKNQKLSLRYFGPFPVVERIGVVAYKLLFPPSTKIHPVFHASQLKVCHGNHDQPYVPLPFTVNDQLPVIQPIAILEDRVIIRGQKQIQQLLVQWEGLDESQATWENKDAIEAAYPLFNLEDKVVSKGRGIVMNKCGEGPELVAVKKTVASEQVAHDQQMGEHIRSTRMRVTSSKLRGFEC